jgi:hypothetical protein
VYSIYSMHSLSIWLFPGFKWNKDKGYVSATVVFVVGIGIYFHWLCYIRNSGSDAEVRFWTEVRTWTSWTEPKVRFKVQSFCWTEPKVQFKVQPVIERFEPELNLGLKLAN